jgi:hypothetical protein
MSARMRDVLCLVMCAVIGAIIWALHLSSLPHSTQRPLKVAVIVFGLMAVGGWRTWQIRHR